jgi:transposase-like protein
MKKYEYRDASPENKAHMITDIVSLYNTKNKNEIVQALAQAQAVLDCNQDEFADVLEISSRSLRNWKKEFQELYLDAYEQFTPDAPELVDVPVDLTESSLEAVYENLLSRLQNKNTATKDLAQILQYFNISGTELRAYASSRNKSLRTFYKDAESVLVNDEDTAMLIKSMIVESNFMYQATPQTVGATEKYLSMDMDNPLVRLEVQTMGLLFMGLWNGNISPQFVEFAETLRILKYADGQNVSTHSHNKFEEMDGQPKKLKPLKVTEKDLIANFGEEEGKKFYELLTAKVDNKTKVKLPQYETVRADYMNKLQVFSGDTPWEVVMANIDSNEVAKAKLQDKYNEFLTTEEN